jgi:hypothetical protein
MPHSNETSDGGFSRSFRLDRLEISPRGLGPIEVLFSLTRQHREQERAFPAFLECLPNGLLIQLPQQQRNTCWRLFRKIVEAIHYDLCGFGCHILAHVESNFLVICQLQPQGDAPVFDP